MNPLKTFCLVACLLAAAFASPDPKQRSNSGENNLKPTQWLSTSELEQIPSVDQITLQRLENMPVQEGAKLIEQLYHLSQIGNELQASFVPSPSNIPAYIVKPNGQNVNANLNTLVDIVKQQQNFGEQEVTIFITGLPETSQPVAKATRKLVQAYMQRYSKQQRQPNKEYDYDSKQRTSSEEDYNEAWKSQKSVSGDLIVIDLGATLNSLKRFAMLDVEQTGEMVGKVLVKLTNQANIPREIIHIVSQGIAAHVAGVAGREYTRLTGNQLRRITALDPSKVFARDPKTLTGLARGDAQLVDAIHTSAYGMGTRLRVGNVDFFPNGPSAAVPGATNVIEAAMRATRYFTESVRPGNERNFPAVAASSLKNYQNNNGHGKRGYMGIATDFDLEGDYMLQVNSHSPFGKSAPAQKQNTYHGVHQAWKNARNQDYE
ncbi:vitellogenin-1-like [Teleopsis dalmanni]|uniref:vitellogenin-1-like n=1 Tax=Teleopsis dalmanni TaxID=139649 RepID=UPI0018CF536E|nr:vitellogenin-1-like [Teleopsis dalmanni]XP_037938134.1 vitellogenin-1-like [Teleopsis dalmanni]